MSKRCPECSGRGYIICPVCHGSSKDPRYEDRDCTYCGGESYIKCPVCDGSGEIDDNDDYRA